MGILYVPKVGGRQMAKYSESRPNSSGETASIGPVCEYNCYLLRHPCHHQLLTGKQATPMLTEVWRTYKFTTDESYRVHLMKLVQMIQQEVGPQYTWKNCMEMRNIIESKTRDSVFW